MLSYDIVNHVRRQKAISLQTSGEGERPRAVIARLRETLREIERDPRNTEAMASMVTIAAEGAWRAGMTPENFAVALSGHLDNPRSSSAMVGKRTEIAPVTEAASAAAAKASDPVAGKPAKKAKRADPSRATRQKRAKKRREDLGPIIIPLRREGLTYAAIAKRLNAAGIPTYRSTGEWNGGMVHYLFQSFPDEQ